MSLRDPDPLSSAIPKRVAIVIANPAISTTSGSPLRIENEIELLGANYVQAGFWRSLAVGDGNPITGQQNFSGAETARLVIEALGR